MKQKIRLSELAHNDGQIEGIDRNPRYIEDENYKALVESLKKDPEFLEHRGLLVKKHNDEYVVLGGNQRLDALKEAGFEEVYCEVIPEDTPIEKIKSYIIKDNQSYGKWNFAAIEATGWVDFIAANKDLAFELPTKMEEAFKGEWNTNPVEKRIAMDYTIFFDSKDELEMFHSFLNKLRKRFEGVNNVSKRILAWIAELYEENGQYNESQLLLRLIKVDMEQDEDDNKNDEEIDYARYKDDGI